jgi:hypothetical protein
LERVQRSLSRRKTPPNRTLSGIQKWMSVAIARYKLRGVWLVGVANIAASV